MTTELMLRTCSAAGTIHNGFRWPESGPVSCDDWNPNPECGHGLHGLLRGSGDGSLLDWSDGARWLVVEIESDDAVDLGGKIKVPRGVVVYCGTRDEATRRIVERYGPSCGCVGAVISGGDRATVTGGYRATVTGGNGATVTGGDRATVTGGYRATVTGGDRATVTGGDRATVTGGDRATVTGGNEATLSVRWWDGRRYRIAVGYVGEDGIEVGVAYQCDDTGRLVRAEELTR